MFNFVAVQSTKHKTENQKITFIFILLFIASADECYRVWLREHKTKTFLK